MEITWWTVTAAATPNDHCLSVCPPPCGVWPFEKRIIPQGGLDVAEGLPRPGSKGYPLSFLNNIIII